MSSKRSEVRLDNSAVIEEATASGDRGGANQGPEASTGGDGSSSMIDQVDQSESSVIGRPPDMANRAAVLNATNELLAEVGYADMTIDAVAKRAGLYRNLIYRTWSNKLFLVREALLGDIPNLVAPDHGNLADDLAAIIRQQTAIVCSPAYVRGMPGLMTAMMSDRELRQDTHEQYAKPVIRRFRLAIDRAVQRGEIRSGQFDPRTLLLTLGGVAQQFAQDGHYTHEEISDHIITLVCHGMVPWND